MTMQGYPPRLLALSEQCPPAMQQRDYWSIRDFLLVREVGTGAASTVYYGVCRKSCLPCAIKMYNKSKLTRLNKHQVEREVNIHASLRHPHVIDFYAAFEDDDRVYLIMEFAAGGDLFDEVKRRGGRLPENEVVCGVLYPYLCALAYLHSRGIIHRDIKPENTVFTRDKVMKVTDFGLAVDGNAERPVTRLGTLDYMAPEVLMCPDKHAPEDNKHRSDLAYGPAVDAWAMGVLAYELIVGRPPFGMSCRDATMRAIAGARPAIPEWLSPGAADFISGALSKDPHGRSSVAQLLQHPWILAHTRATLYRQPSLACSGESTAFALHHNPGHQASTLAVPVAAAGRSTATHQVCTSPPQMLLGTQLGGSPPQHQLHLGNGPARPATSHERPSTARGLSSQQRAAVGVTTSSGHYSHSLSASLGGGSAGDGNEPQFQQAHTQQQLAMQQQQQLLQQQHQQQQQQQMAAAAHASAGGARLSQQQLQQQQQQQRRTGSNTSGGASGGYEQLQQQQMPQQPLVHPSLLAITHELAMQHDMSLFGSSPPVERPSKRSAMQRCASAAMVGQPSAWPSSGQQAGAGQEGGGAYIQHQQQQEAVASQLPHAAYAMAPAAAVQYGQPQQMLHHHPLLGMHGGSGRLNGAGFAKGHDTRYWCTDGVGWATEDPLASTFNALHVQCTTSSTGAALSDAMHQDQPGNTAHPNLNELLLMGVSDPFRSLRPLGHASHSTSGAVPTLGSTATSRGPVAGVGYGHSSATHATVGPPEPWGASPLGARGGVQQLQQQGSGGGGLGTPSRTPRGAPNRDLVRSLSKSFSSKRRTPEVSSEAALAAVMAAEAAGITLPNLQAPDISPPHSAQLPTLPPTFTPSRLASTSSAGTPPPATAAAAAAAAAALYAAQQAPQQQVLLTRVQAAALHKARRMGNGENGLQLQLPQSWESSNSQDGGAMPVLPSPGSQPLSRSNTGGLNPSTPTKRDRATAERETVRPTSDESSSTAWMLNTWPAKPMGGSGSLAAALVGAFGNPASSNGAAAVRAGGSVNGGSGGSHPQLTIPVSPDQSNGSGLFSPGLSNGSGMSELLRALQHTSTNSPQQQQHHHQPQQQVLLLPGQTQAQAQGGNPGDGVLFTMGSTGQAAISQGGAQGVHHHGHMLSLHAQHAQHVRSHPINSPLASPSCTPFISRQNSTVYASAGGEQQQAGLTVGLIDGSMLPHRGTTGGLAASGHQHQMPPRTGSGSWGLRTCGPSITDSGLAAQGFQGLLLNSGGAETYLDVFDALGEASSGVEGGGAGQVAVGAAPLSAPHSQHAHYQQQQQQAGSLGSGFAAAMGYPNGALADQGAQLASAFGAAGGQDRQPPCSGGGGGVPRTLVRQGSASPALGPAGMPLQQQQQQQQVLVGGGGGGQSRYSRSTSSHRAAVSIPPNVAAGLCSNGSGPGSGPPTFGDLVAAPAGHDMQASQRPGSASQVQQAQQVPRNMSFPTLGLGAFGAGGPAGGHTPQLMYPAHQHSSGGAVAAAFGAHPGPSPLGLRSSLTSSVAPAPEGAAGLTLGSSGALQSAPRGPALISHASAPSATQLQAMAGPSCHLWTGTAPAYAAALREAQQQASTAADVRGAVGQQGDSMAGMEGVGVGAVSAEFLDSSTGAPAVGPDWTQLLDSATGDNGDLDLDMLLDAPSDEG